MTALPANIRLKMQRRRNVAPTAPQEWNIHVKRPAARFNTAASAAVSPALKSLLTTCLRLIPLERKSVGGFKMPILHIAPIPREVKEMVIQQLKNEQLPYNKQSAFSDIDIDVAELQRLTDTHAIDEIDNVSLVWGDPTQEPNTTHFAFGCCRSLAINLITGEAELSEESIVPTRHSWDATWNTSNVFEAQLDGVGYVMDFKIDPEPTGNWGVDRRKHRFKKVQIQIKPVWDFDVGRQFLSDAHNGDADRLRTALSPGTREQALAARSKQGYSALHLAASGFHQEAVAELLEHAEVEVDEMSKNGLTPLMVAVRHLNMGGMVLPDAAGERATKRKMAVLKLLLHRGANPCIPGLREMWVLSESLGTQRKGLRLSALGIAVNKLSVSKINPLRRYRQSSRNDVKTREFDRQQGSEIHGVLELLMAFAPDPHHPVFCDEPRLDKWCDAYKWHCCRAYPVRKNRVSNAIGSQCSVWHWLIRRAFAIRGDCEHFFMEPPQHYFNTAKNSSINTHQHRTDGYQNLPPMIFPSSLRRGKEDVDDDGNIVRPSAGEEDQIDEAAARQHLLSQGLPLFEYLLCLPGCGRTVFMDALRDVLWSGQLDALSIQWRQFLFPPDLTSMTCQLREKQDSQEDEYSFDQTTIGSSKVPVASRLGFNAAENVSHGTREIALLFSLQRPGAYVGFVV